jgi:hypothetical protein
MKVVADLAVRTVVATEKRWVEQKDLHLVEMRDGEMAGMMVARSAVQSARKKAAESVERLADCLAEH